jgi:hypothetical protein
MCTSNADHLRANSFKILLFSIVNFMYSKIMTLIRSKTRRNEPKSIQNLYLK